MPLHGRWHWRAHLLALTVLVCLLAQGAAAPPAIAMAGGIERGWRPLTRLQGVGLRPSTTGARALQAATDGTLLFSTSFDDQAPGPLVTGTQPNQFTGTGHAARLSVQNAVAASPPNALAVAVAGGDSAYAARKYDRAYATQDLQFSVQLSSDFALGSSGDYLELAQTAPSTTTNVGKVNIILAPSRKLRLDYFDSAGVQHWLYGTGYVLPLGSWHTLALQETVGAGNGSLTLLVDGTAVVSGGSTLDTGLQGVSRFGVGAVYSPSDAATSGSIYVDDVMASAPSSDVTPTATASPTATATTTPPDASTAFETNFDDQSTGALVTGDGANQFTGTAGDAASLTVENTLVASPPNALAVPVTNGTPAYVYKQYSTGAGYADYDLRFRLALGADFTLPANEFLVLATLAPDAHTLAGSVQVALDGYGLLELDYVDSRGWLNVSYSFTLWPFDDAWHTLEVRQSGGSGGSEGADLALLLDGTPIITISGADVGPQRVGYVALGNVFSPPDAGTRGHLYLDDVLARSSSGLQPLPSATPTQTPVPGTPGQPTPTPTEPPL